MVVLKQMGGGVVEANGDGVSGARTALGPAVHHRQAR